jgi:hypothetical protein
MDCFCKSLRSAGPGLLAVAILGLLPLAAEAAGMGFKNETNATIYVQGFTNVGGKIVRGPLLQIAPGKTLWDVNLMKGDRVIKITDPANRVLFNEVVSFNGKDTLYGVVPFAQPKGPPKVLLEARDLPPGH